jgi:hypothetical protein
MSSQTTNQEPRVPLNSTSTVHTISAGHRRVVDDHGSAAPALVALPMGMIAMPATGLRRPGGPATGLDFSDTALVIEAVRALVSGEAAIFAAPVVIAPVVVRRGGRIQSGGHLSDHVRLGVLEDHLPPGAIEDLVERYGVGVVRLRGLSAPMAIRCVLAMTLLPGASLGEVMATTAGQLVKVPWARPWQVPGGEVLTRHRRRLGEGLFEELAALTCAQIAGEPEHTMPPPQSAPSPPGAPWFDAELATGWLGGLLLCAGDGMTTRCPDTAANRKTFGSTGTSDDSAPYPQVRAVVISVCSTRAVLGAALDGCHVGEQTLTARIATDSAGVFTAGRLFLFDRNFLGASLVADVLATGAHLLMRMKAGITLPNLGWLPDGSYRSRLRKPDGDFINVRVVDYDVIPPGQTPTGELFCLVTDLLDHEAFPAAALAATYPWRWTGSETTFREDKSTITDAGPSRGPIFRSTTPEMVRQELWAWITATNLIRATARAAIRTPVPSTPTRPAAPCPPRAVSFTTTRHEAIRSILASTPTNPAHLARTLRKRRIQLNRNRHRARVTKCRQQFPSAKPRTPTTTGPSQILIRRPQNLALAPPADPDPTPKPIERHPKTPGHVEPAAHPDDTRATTTPKSPTTAGQITATAPYQPYRH